MKGNQRRKTVYEQISDINVKLVGRDRCLSNRISKVLEHISGDQQDVVTNEFGHKAHVRHACCEGDRAPGCGWCLITSVVGKPVKSC